MICSGQSRCCSTCSTTSPNYRGARRSCCFARPAQSCYDARPGWGGGKLTATTTLLEPLVVKEAEALLEELGDGLDQETRVRVIKASEGNPLFLEEMVGACA